MTTEPSFEAAQQELEQIVERLERGQAPLDEAIALWERGEELYKLCLGKLDAAHGRIDELARREVERPPVVRLCGSRVQVGGPLSREQEEADELALDVGPALSGGVEELERLPVVVDEDLGVVSHALGGPLLDPARGREVLLRARPAGDLLVGDVAHERVPERELLLTCDRRDAQRPDDEAGDHGTAVRRHVDEASGN